MRRILEESDMRIYYEDEQCYAIEKSSLVAKLRGVKIVEFVQVQSNKKIRLLEAKTTAPNPTNDCDYNNYLKEIREKFQNSISLLNAAKLHRRPTLFQEFPETLKNVDFRNASYFLFLVIKKQRLDWLPPLTDDLRRQLHPFLKCWNIPDDNFVVLNEELARDFNIVE